MWVKSYTVQEGDSWTSIAGDMYGDQKYFAMLASFNGWGPDDVLRPGDVIDVPDLLGIETGNPIKPEVPTGSFEYYGGGQPPMPHMGPNFPYEQEFGPQAPGKPWNPPYKAGMASLPPGVRATPSELPMDIYDPEYTKELQRYQEYMNFKNQFGPNTPAAGGPFQNLALPPGPSTPALPQGQQGMFQETLPQPYEEGIIIPSTGDLGLYFQNASTVQGYDWWSPYVQQIYSKYAGPDEDEDPRMQEMYQAQLNAAVMSLAANPGTPLPWLDYLYEILDYRTRFGDLGYMANPLNAMQQPPGQGQPTQPPSQSTVNLPTPGVLTVTGSPSYIPPQQFLTPNPQTISYWSNALSGMMMSKNYIDTMLAIHSGVTGMGTPTAEQTQMMLSAGFNEKQVRDALLWTARAFTWGSVWMSKFWERMAVLPAFLGYPGPGNGLNLWGDLIMKDIQPKLPMVQNPETGAWGWWRIGGNYAGPEGRGWQFVTPSTYDTWVQSQYALAPFVMENAALTVEQRWDLRFQMRRWQFDRFIVNPDGSINWPYLVGTTNGFTFMTGQSQRMKDTPYNFIANVDEAMWLAGGLSGMATSFWVPEDGEVRWMNFIKLAEEGASLIDINESGLVVDPWSEFIFDFLTDPTLALSLMGGSLGDFINLVQFPIGPLVAKGIGAVANKVLRANISTIRTMYQKAYTQKGGLMRFILGISKNSLAIQYGEHVQDAMTMVARMYDPAIDGDMMVFFQRFLDRDPTLFANRAMAFSRSEQLDEAIEALTRAVGSTDLQDILKKYGVWEEIVDPASGERVVNGVLKHADDPEAIGHYIARAISSQFRKELGLVPRAPSVSRFFGWLGTALKEDWLMLNPKYIMGNISTNFGGAIVSGYSPNFDLNYWMKALTYLEEEFGWFMPSNVIQSLLGAELSDLLSVEGRILANEMIPIPFLGTPRGIAHFIYRWTGKKLPQGIYDFMNSDAAIIKFFDTFSWGGFMRKWQDFSTSVEKSQRARTLVEALETFLYGEEGFPFIIKWLDEPVGPGGITPSQLYPGLKEDIASGRVKTVKDMRDWIERIRRPAGPAEPPVRWSGMAPEDTPRSEAIDMLRDALDPIHVKAVNNEITALDAIAQADAQFNRIRDAAIEMWDVEMRNINNMLNAPESWIFDWIAKNFPDVSGPEFEALRARAEIEKAREAGLEQFRAQDPGLATNDEIAQGVPTSITTRMTESLHSLGWTDDQIRHMSVGDAWEIIQRGEIPTVGGKSLDDLGRELDQFGAKKIPGTEMEGPAEPSVPPVPGTPPAPGMPGDLGYKITITDEPFGFKDTPLNLYEIAIDDQKISEVLEADDLFDNPDKYFPNLPPDVNVELLIEILLQDFTPLAPISGELSVDQVARSIMQMFEANSDGADFYMNSDVFPTELTGFIPAVQYLLDQGFYSRYTNMPVRRAGWEGLFHKGSVDRLYQWYGVKQQTELLSELIYDIQDHINDLAGADRLYDPEGAAYAQRALERITEHIPTDLPEEIRDCIAYYLFNWDERYMNRMGGTPEDLLSTLAAWARYWETRVLGIDNLLVMFNLKVLGTLFDHMSSTQIGDTVPLYISAVGIPVMSIDMAVYLTERVPSDLPMDIRVLIAERIYFIDGNDVPGDSNTYLRRFVAAAHDFLAGNKTPEGVDAAYIRLDEFIQDVIDEAVDSDENPETTLEYTNAPAPNSTISNYDRKIANQPPAVRDAIMNYAEDILHAVWSDGLQSWAVPISETWAEEESPSFTPISDLEIMKSFIQWARRQSATTLHPAVREWLSVFSPKTEGLFGDEGEIVVAEPPPPGEVVAKLFGSDVNLGHVNPEDYWGYGQEAFEAVALDVFLDSLPVAVDPDIKQERIDFWNDFELAAIGNFVPSKRNDYIDAGFISGNGIIDDIMRLYNDYPEMFAENARLQALIDETFEADAFIANPQNAAMAAERLRAFEESVKLYFADIAGRKIEDVTGAVKTFYHSEDFKIWKYLEGEGSTVAQPSYPDYPFTELRAPEITDKHKEYILQSINERLEYDTDVIEKLRGTDKLDPRSNNYENIFNEVQLLKQLQVLIPGPQMLQVIYNFFQASPTFAADFLPNTLDILQLVRAAAGTLLGQESVEVLMRNWVVAYVIPDAVRMWKQLMRSGYTGKSWIFLGPLSDRAWLGNVYMKVPYMDPTTANTLSKRSIDEAMLRRQGGYYLIYKPYGLFNSNGPDWIGSAVGIQELWKDFLPEDAWKYLQENELLGALLNPKLNSPGQFNIIVVESGANAGSYTISTNGALSSDMARSLIGFGMPRSTLFIDISDTTVYPNGRVLGTLSDFMSTTNYAPSTIVVKMTDREGTTVIDLTSIYELVIKSEDETRFGYHPATKNIVVGRNFDMPHEAGEPSMAERFAPLDEWLTVKKGADGTFSVSVGKSFMKTEKGIIKGFSLAGNKWPDREFGIESAIAAFANMLCANGMGDSIIIDMTRKIKGTAASMTITQPIIKLASNLRGTFEELAMEANSGTFGIDVMSNQSVLKVLYTMMGKAVNENVATANANLESTVVSLVGHLVDRKVKKLSDLPKTSEGLYQLIVNSRERNVNQFWPEIRHAMHSILEHGGKSNVMKGSWLMGSGWSFDANVHPGGEIDATIVGPRNIAFVRWYEDKEEYYIAAIRELYEQWGVPLDFTVSMWERDNQETRTIAGWLGMPESVEAGALPTMSVTYRIVDMRSPENGGKFGSMTAHQQMVFKSYIDGNPQGKGVLIGLTTANNETLWTCDANAAGNHQPLRDMLGLGLGDLGQWAWNGVQFQGTVESYEHLRLIGEEIYLILRREKKYAQIPMFFSIRVGPQQFEHWTGNLGDLIGEEVKKPYKHVPTMQELFRKGGEDWRQQQIHRVTTEMTQMLDSLYRWQNKIHQDMGVDPVTPVPAAPQQTTVPVDGFRSAAYARQQETEDMVARRAEYYKLLKARRLINKPTGGIFYGDWLIRKLGWKPSKEELDRMIEQAGGVDKVLAGGPPQPPQPPQPPTTQSFFRSEQEREDAVKFGAEVMKKWMEMFDEATWHAIGEVNRIFHDYHAFGNPETLLKGYAPFTTWQLRNPLFWAQVLAKKPGILAWLIRYYATAEQDNQQRNMTQRFNRFVGTNIPEGSVIPAGYYATDPSVAIPVLQQFRPPFEAPGSLQPTDNKMINFLRKVIQFGRTAGLSPYPWFSLPMEYLGLIPRGSTQISLGPLQRIAELYLQATHQLKPGQGIFGGNYTSEYLNDYYTRMEIPYMEAQGLMTHEEALNALMNKYDEHYLMAQQRVLDRNAVLGTFGNISYLPIKYASPGEMIIRGIKGGLERAEQGATEPLAGTYEAYQEARMNDWLYTQYPFLETYSLAMGNDPQRIQLAEIFYRYEQALTGLHPWQDDYKDLIAQRSVELERIYGPMNNTAVTMNEYLRNPISVGEARGLSEWEMQNAKGEMVTKYYTEPEARVEVLSRLREVEPRASEFMSQDGLIDWEKWDAAHESFLNSIDQVSKAFGYEVSLDDYLAYRYRKNSTEEIAYAMYRNWVNDQWEKYEEMNTKMQPGTSFYNTMINTAGQIQYVNDITAGFTPYEADIRRAESLLRWQTDGLDYEYYEMFRKMYIDPIFAQEPNLGQFAGRVATIMGLGDDPMELSDLRKHLNYQMQGISNYDPIRNARTELNDYFYNRLTPVEQMEVEQYFGIEKIPEDDGKMMEMYMKLKSITGIQTTMGGEVLVYQEHPSIPLPPLSSYLDEKEIALINQFRVDMFRYGQAREAGVLGTWTPLMDEYMYDPDSPQTEFWTLLSNVSLNDTAYNDPVLNTFLSRVSRSLLEFTDEQWSAAVSYLKENWDLFIDVEGTQAIQDHPDWYLLAMQERDAYDRYRDIEMEVLKSQYYSIPNSKYDPSRRNWEASHPDEYQKLKDYMQRELTRAFQYPYFMYFFKQYDYGRYFGSSSPSMVASSWNMQTISSDFQKAIDDMNAYINGSGIWTPGMIAFFGPPPPGYQWPNQVPHD